MLFALQPAAKNHIIIFLSLGRDHQFSEFFVNAKSNPNKNPENR
jgi:hypothetical protein